MGDVKIVGDVVYPEVGTRWVDNQDDSRTLTVEVVEPGDRLGREIRGLLNAATRVAAADSRAIDLPYATDIRTFNGVWRRLGVPVASS